MTQNSWNSEDRAQVAKGGTGVTPSLLQMEANGIIHRSLTFAI